MRRWLVLCFMGLAGPLAAQPVTFGLFGDTPYSARERAQLPALMAEMARHAPAFVVHDGDIKSGSSRCSDELFLDILAQFQSFAQPLIYVPGDNEWTDCHRASNGGYDPQERLDRLRTLFFDSDLSLGQRRIRLERQSSDPQFAAYRENVRWQAGGALFIALNLPGSDNNYHGVSGGGGPAPEFLARSVANRAWLAQGFALARARRLAGVLIVIQANPEFEAAAAGHTKPAYRGFIDQLRQETLAFAGQVVLVHGDSHRQHVDQPLLDAAGRKRVDNFTRVETFGSPEMGWIRATVDTADPRVFRFEPRRWPG